MMKKLFLILLLIGSLALFAQNFDLETLNDQTIHIKNFDGNFLFQDETYQKRPVLFFFFGTRCPFCEKEIPQIIKLVQHKGIKVIGVQAQFPVADQTLKQFREKKEINFEVLKAKDGNKLIRYLKQKRMWVGGVPFYVLSDKYGNLEPLELSEVLKKLQ